MRNAFKHLVDSLLGKRCDHKWSPVKLLRFSGSGEVSEVVRCTLCGEMSVIEKAEESHSGNAA